MESGRKERETIKLDLCPQEITHRKREIKWVENLLWVVSYYSHIMDTPGLIQHREITLLVGGVVKPN